MCYNDREYSYIVIGKITVACASLGSEGERTIHRINPIACDTYQGAKASTK
jgi:hypothetical protein